MVIDERLLKTDLQSGSYKETLLGFSYQVGIFPRDGKVGKRHRWHGDAQVCFQDSSSFIFLIFFFSVSPSLQIFVNDAQINSSNLLAGKGVIHGLSSVLPISRNRCDKATYTKVQVESQTTVKKKEKDGLNCLSNMSPLFV